MTEEIKEVVETVSEMDVENVVAPIVEGPTIFKTSNKAKIVFGTVIGGVLVYGACKGVRWYMNKRKGTKEAVMDVPFEEVDDEFFDESDVEEN